MVKMGSVAGKTHVFGDIAVRSKPHAMEDEGCSLPLPLRAR